MDIYPGRIVVSTAGRDKDRYFIVLSRVDENYCLIADGDVRKVDMPKKKKMKHLRVTNFFLESVKEKLETNQTVTNSMLRKNLKLFSENNPTS